VLFNHVGQWFNQLGQAVMSVVADPTATGYYRKEKVVIFLSEK
jgi:hypothetical protein